MPRCGIPAPFRRGTDVGTARFARWTRAGCRSATTPTNNFEKHGLEISIAPVAVSGEIGREHDHDL